MIISLKFRAKYIRVIIMDNKQKKDPYNFAKTEEGLKKRFRLISAKREEYKKKEKNKEELQ